jgi:alkylhydroperoxidase/carboxymuconolactone decarboxylase family protein YurZ
MRKLAPFDFDAWLNLNNIVGRKRRRSASKVPRTLIAVAVVAPLNALTHSAHAKAARAAGASREELVEAAFVAAALRAGGAATHGAMALKFFDGE